MPSDKEQLRILQMIQSKKITPDEGVKLLDALQKTDPKISGGNSAIHTQGLRTPRWMRILVVDQKTGKEKINFRLPANVVETGVKMGACYSPGLNNNATKKILEALHTGLTGKVIDSIIAETGERIVISLE